MTSPLRLLRTVATGAVLAVAIGAHVAPSVPTGTDAIAPTLAMPSHCRTWDIPDTDASTVKAEQLIGQGWYGVATDGAERLYSPVCH